MSPHIPPLAAAPAAALAATLAAALAAAALLAAPPSARADGVNLAVGPLDLPLPETLLERPARTVETEELRPAPEITDQASLERAVEREQTTLERLDRGTLERRAEEGERGAQVALGTDLAREAEKLAFAPAAANDALSDAVRWYSLAASRGYPGAPSLDRAGVRFYPIRVHR